MTSLDLLLSSVFFFYPHCISLYSHNISGFFLVLLFNRYLSSFPSYFHFSRDQYHFIFLLFHYVILFSFPFLKVILFVRFLLNFLCFFFLLLPSLSSFYIFSFLSQSIISLRPSLPFLLSPPLLSFSCILLLFLYECEQGKQKKCPQHCYCGRFYGKQNNINQATFLGRTDVEPVIDQQALKFTYEHYSYLCIFFISSWSVFILHLHFVCYLIFFLSCIIFMSYSLLLSCV